MDDTIAVIIWVCISIIIVIVVAIAIDRESERAELQKQKSEKEREKYNRLLKLENLKDMGAITEKEYELEKYKIKYE